MAALQPYDFLMLAVLVLSTLFGAWKGMAWQLAALASIILSAGVAAHFSGPLAPMFSQQEPWNRFLAMLVLYVVTSLVIWLVFRMVSEMIDRVQLKEFDRQLGALFGGAKGVLWCIVITFFAVTLSEPARQTILRSRSGYWIAVVTERGGAILPQEVRAHLGKYIEELDRKLDPHTPASPGTTTMPLEFTKVSESTFEAGACDVPRTEMPNAMPRIRYCVAYDGGVCYVIRQGPQPGDDLWKLPITDNDTVLDTLSKVKGLSQLSDKKIWIARPTADGSHCQQLLPVDWASIAERSDYSTNYLVMPGDRIFIANDRRQGARCLERFTAPIERLLGILGLNSSTIRSGGVSRDYNRGSDGF